MNMPSLDFTGIDDQEVFLGRQPILNRKQKTVAYELLFRSENSLDVADVSDDLASTAAVIVNALSQFGLEHVIGKHLAFINVSASLLMSETLELLPPERIVLEVLEDVAITNIIIERCKSLKAKGSITEDTFGFSIHYSPFTIHIIDGVNDQCAPRCR